MHKCNTVLQTKKDLFHPEIRPNSPEKCHFSTFFRLPKFPNTFGHCPVKSHLFTFYLFPINFLDEFPLADICKIKSKLSQLDKEQIKSSLTNLDHDSKGKLTFDKFFSAIKNSFNLIDHEIVTLARFYGGQLESNKDEVSQIVNQVQANLKESRFEAFPHITLDCKLEDSRKSGFIALNTLADICMKHSLPLSPEIFEQLIRCIDRNNQNKVDYQQFVTYINWRDSPAKNLFSTRRSDIGMQAAGSGSWPQFETDVQDSYEVDFTRMISEVF